MAVKVIGHLRPPLQSRLKAGFRFENQEIPIAMVEVSIMGWRVVGWWARIWCLIGQVSIAIIIMLKSAISHCHLLFIETHWLMDIRPQSDQLVVGWPVGDPPANLDCSMFLFFLLANIDIEYIDMSRRLNLVSIRRQFFPSTWFLTWSSPTNWPFQPNVPFVSSHPT